MENLDMLVYAMHDVEQEKLLFYVTNDRNDTVHNLMCNLNIRGYAQYQHYTNVMLSWYKQSVPITLPTFTTNRAANYQWYRCIATQIWNLVVTHHSHFGDNDLVKLLNEVLQNVN